MGFTGLQWVLPSFFSGFYWVLLGFTEFNRVLPGIRAINCVEIDQAVQIFQWLPVLSFVPLPVCCCCCCFACVCVGVSSVCVCVCVCVSSVWRAVISAPNGGAYCATTGAAAAMKSIGPFSRRPCYFASARVCASLSFSLSQTCRQWKSHARPPPDGRLRSDWTRRRSPWCLSMGSSFSFSRSV